MVGVGVPLAAVADLLRLGEEHCEDLVLRAGVGVGEARLAPDLERSRRSATASSRSVATSRRGG